MSLTTQDLAAIGQLIDNKIDSKLDAYRDWTEQQFVRQEQKIDLVITKVDQLTDTVEVMRKIQYAEATRVDKQAKVFAKLQNAFTKAE